ncbi:MAG: YgjV family protein [Clostridia bacterium]|nr:YgjV family protein [Clostridia bacterium]
MTKFLSETLGIWYLIILNAFGVMAVIIKTTELQLKSRKMILIFALMANISWIFYFGLQGGFSSAITFVVSIMQVIVFSFREKQKWANSKIWLVVFIALQLLAWYITKKSWYDVLPVIAGVLSVFAYFVFDEDKYRILIFIYALVWIANSTVNFYIVSLISDLSCLISSIIAIIRYNVLKTHKRLDKQSNSEVSEKNTESAKNKKISEQK